MSTKTATKVAALFVTVFGAAMATWVTAADVTWRGANTTALDAYARANWLAPAGAQFTWKPGYGAATTAAAAVANTVSVDGHNLWDNSSTPGVDDNARFVWALTSALAKITDGTTGVVSWVVLNGAFGPGHITHSSSAFGSVPSDISVEKDLSIQTLTYASGYTTGIYGQFFVRSGYTWTLTGSPHPFTFSGYQGGWHAFQLDAGAKVDFTGSDIVFDYFHTYQDGAMGGTGGQLVFSNPDSSITLGRATETYFRPAIAVAAHRLRVHEDQTWLNPTGAGYIYVARSGTDDTVVESIGGAPLNNLGQAAFRIHTASTSTLSHYVLSGIYQGFRLTCARPGGGTATTIANLKLNGDVTFAGGAVVPPDGSQTYQYESDYGLQLPGGGRMGWEVYLQSYNLTLTRGVYLGGSAGGYTTTLDGSYIIADNRTLDIGGDLVFAEATFPAGNLVGGVLNESRRIGVSGNAATVVNLRGSFTSNTRSATRNSNLYLATVNLIGGTSGDPNTFEVCADPANNVADDTYAMGTVHVGTTPTDTAYVRLVNASINDNDSANPAKSKVGEVLLAGTLAIGPNSTLDCNNEGVKVATALSIDATGTLDLNTGMTLSGPTVYTAFFGVGNQAATWNGFKDSVTDSDNPAYHFEAEYAAGDGKTYWKALSPPAGTVIIMK